MHEKGVMCIPTVIGAGQTLKHTLKTSSLVYIKLIPDIKKFTGIALDVKSLVTCIRMKNIFMSLNCLLCITAWGRKARTLWLD